MTIMGRSISSGRSMCVCRGCKLAGPVVRDFICTSMYAFVCFYVSVYVVYLRFILRGIIYDGILMLGLRAEGWNPFGVFFPDLCSK